MREEPFATVLALDDLLVVTSKARGGLTQADMPIATTANINGSRSAVDVRFVDGKKGPGAVRRSSATQAGLIGSQQREPLGSDERVNRVERPAAEIPGPVGARLIGLDRRGPRPDPQRRSRTPSCQLLVGRRDGQRSRVGLGVLLVGQPNSGLGTS
jgi:hypothetical protein